MLSSKLFAVSDMMNFLYMLAVSLLSFATYTRAFAPRASSPVSVANKRHTLRMAVTEVLSIAELDEAISAAGDKLVVVDYSTTWCGPCKMVWPKYKELSERYSDVVFLNCVGDATPEASALMKRETVRSVPTFHMWKAGGRVDVVNGAKIEEVRRT